MLKRMTQRLKESYSHLGLPESVLNSVAKVAIIGLSDDVSDEDFDARVADASISEMLKGFQSHADRVRGKKVKDVKNKDVDVDEPDDDAPAWFKSYVEKSETDRKSLLDKIAALEGAESAKKFDSLVSSIGSELGLSSSMLDLVRPGLSSDMDETAIRNKLGATKKALIENGVKFEEKVDPNDVSRDASYREDARAWCKAQLEAQKE
jgi:hypothetical protein